MKKCLSLSLLLIALVSAAGSLFSASPAEQLKTIEDLEMKALNLLVAKSGNKLAECSEISSDLTTLGLNYSNLLTELEQNPQASPQHLKAAKEGSLFWYNLYGKKNEKTEYEPRFTYRPTKAEKTLPSAQKEVIRKLRNDLDAGCKSIGKGGRALEKILDARTKALLTVACVGTISNDDSEETSRFLKYEHFHAARAVAPAQKSMINQRINDYCEDLLSKQYPTPDEQRVIKRCRKDGNPAADLTKQRKRIRAS